MAEIQIAVINASTAVSDDEVRAAAAALQIQVRRDFAPVWGIDADLTVVPRGGTPGAGAWWLVILDTSDSAGALGYHDLTPEGLPLAKVFAQSALKLGYQWTVTASHELLEMLADPDVVLTAFVEATRSTGTLYAYEVCDACEADQFGYAIQGTQVSDFVHPAWFESFRQPGSTQFDHESRIRQPFGLLAGGYIGVYDVKAGGGWRQLTAEPGADPYRARPRAGSRTERRRTPRVEWIRSRSDAGLALPRAA